MELKVCCHSIVAGLLAFADTNHTKPSQPRAMVPMRGACFTHLVIVPVPLGRGRLQRQRAVRAVHLDAHGSVQADAVGLAGLPRGPQLALLHAKVVDRRGIGRNGLHSTGQSAHSTGPRAEQRVRGSVQLGDAMNRTSRVKAWRYRNSPLRELLTSGWSAPEVADSPIWYVGTLLLCSATHTRQYKGSRFKSTRRYRPQEPVSSSLHLEATTRHTHTWYMVQLAVTGSLNTHGVGPSTAYLRAYSVRWYRS